MRRKARALHDHLARDRDARILISFRMTLSIQDMEIQYNIEA